MNKERDGKALTTQEMGRLKCGWEPSHRNVHDKPKVLDFSPTGKEKSVRICEIR